MAQAPAAGYSGTPLVKKLGIKPGFRVRTKNAPSDYMTLIEPLPEGAKVSARLQAPFDIVHFFVRSRAELTKHLPGFIDSIQQAGMIWVSWAKKSSRVVSDVTEDVIRDVALPLGLVDIKVCAVDEVWSGLKLVIRKENRR